MAASTNIYGFNIGGNNNSFDQRGHFYRAFLDGNISGMLVKQNSTPNMTVRVEHGSALLNKNTTSASVAEIKSDTSVAIDTANTSNPRIDTVVIYEDTSISIPTVEANYWQDGAGGRFKIVSLPGTAAASPTALSDASIQTTIGAGKPWTRLANITVPANSTTIINSNINNSVRSKLGVSLPSINGGTTSGLLSTDANGNVTSRPVNRQDNNVNSILSGMKIETGWGWIQVGGSAVSQVNETVTFQTAFTTLPIVLVTYGGDAGNTAPSYGTGGGVAIGAAATKASNITTSSFVATITTTGGTWPANQTMYYQWIAIGN